MKETWPVRWLALALIAGGLVMVVATQGNETQLIESIYKDRAREPWKLQYKTGTVARGVVINETKQTLYLDGDPCNAKNVYQFTDPFEKTATGQKITCDGKQLTEYQVKQGAR
jgi:hypothetical protein